jgi:hypothetical protein
MVAPAAQDRLMSCMKSQKMRLPRAADLLARRRR